MEQFFQDNRQYTTGATTTCGAALPTSRYFDFACTAPGAAAQTYLATATGRADQGMTGFIYTITESNAKTSPLTASGWTTSTSCWVRRKEGAC